MRGKRTWIYCRGAYPDGNKLEAQRAYLAAYAEKQGFTVVGITAEQASGLDFSRPGLREVSLAIETGKVDILLVKDLTRLGRDVQKVDAYLKELKAHHVIMVCADGTILQSNMEILTALMEKAGISRCK